MRITNTHEGFPATNGASLSHVFFVFVLTWLLNPPIGASWRNGSNGVIIKPSIQAERVLFTIFPAELEGGEGWDLEVWQRDFKEICFTRLTTLLIITLKSV